MQITYTVPESKSPKTGKIIKTYEPGKYLVKEDQPIHNQPDYRFVFGSQVISIGEQAR